MKKIVLTESNVILCLDTIGLQFTIIDWFLYEMLKEITAGVVLYQWQFTPPNVVDTAKKFTADVAAFIT